MSNFVFEFDITSIATCDLH